MATGEQDSKAVDEGVEREPGTVTSRSSSAPGGPVRGTGKPRAMGRGRLRHTWAEFRKAGTRDTAVMGKAVPFVGRRKELESLYNTVRDALNRRKSQVAWIHGAPGVGKSRLIGELERAISPAKRGVGWYAVSAGRERGGPPTLVGRLLLELLGGRAISVDPEPWRLVRENLVALVGEKHAGECMAVVAPLLGLAAPEDGGGHRVVREPPLEVAVQFAGSLLRSRGRSGPFLIRIDASNTDQEEVGVVARGLSESLLGISSAVLVESRGQPPRGLRATEFGLTALPREPTLALARHLVKDLIDAPSNLADQLVARSDCNPERLLDLVRGMIAAQDVVEHEGQWRWRRNTEPGGAPALPERAAEHQSDSGALPDRIARLPEDLAEVCAACAIFGPSFWFGGVLSVLRGARRDGPTDAMSDRDRARLKASMMQLQSIELIAFVENSKMSRELEFTFEQPGDAQRVVGQMEAEKRRLYARLAAQWLNCRPRQDPVADTERIAELYQQGGRLRLAAGLFLEAGHAARNVGQIQRAVKLYEAGSRITDTDDADLAADVRTAHGGALLRLSHHDEAEPVLLDALRMARCLEDDVRCGISQLRVAQVARVSGRYETALRFLEGALKHLRVAGAHRWIADVMDEIGLVHLVRGDDDAYKQALAHFLKALALRRRSEDRRVVARSLCHIARIHTGRGHFDDALDSANEAVQICEQIQDLWGSAKARTVLGEVLAASGKHRAALTVWEVGLELAKEVGDASRKVEITIAQAETYIALGQWQDAAALMVDALEAAREVNDPELLSGIYRVQASISLERQALETADLDSMQAVEVARESGARSQVARALLVRGCVLGTRALSETGARSTVTDRKANEAFEQALDAFKAMGDLVRQISGLRSYANYLSQRGGGPRLATVEGRLAAMQSELAQVSGLEPA